jgi:hypothetical protein
VEAPLSLVVSVLLALTPFTEQHLCLDCGAYLPIDVHPAGSSSFYLGRICPECLYVDEILGIFASRHLAQIVRCFLDPPDDVVPPSDL